MSILGKLKKKEVPPILTIVLISNTLKFLKLEKEVELILDNCPPTFDFTEAGNTKLEEIDRSILVMEKINKVYRD